MVKVVVKGDLKKTKKFLGFIGSGKQYRILERYGREGVNALANATPIDSGRTASSWDYEISSDDGRFKLTWTNSNTTDQGTPIAILIQYGHGTKDGYFIEGRDFINPAIRPVFDQIADSVWQEVNHA